jgi:hypothetical protein
MSGWLRLVDPDECTKGLDFFLAATRTAGEIDALRWHVRKATLAEAPLIREPDFSRLSARDLAVMFNWYDDLFFGSTISLELDMDARDLTFRASTRATTRGGALRTWKARETADDYHPERYELSVSTNLLLASFGRKGRAITVVGRECADRLDGLQRIMEHEIIHLVEQIRWRETKCARPRFQEMARRLFGHTSHKHGLVTVREHASKLGLWPGSRVAFEFRGVRHEGILSRVTRRATVLVPDPNGRMMSDGNAYQQFYVPLERLLRC